MKQAIVYAILVTNLLLVACASQPANAQSKRAPIFSVAVKNPEDQVAIQFKDNTTLIEIQSPLGIGSATFTLESGDMPERIVIRIHVKGLEEFQLISEQITLSASVSSSEGITAQSQRKISENSQQALHSSNPLWLNIESVPSSQKIPLQDGFFEIFLPKEFIRQAGNTFEIKWIDFYR
jgi:hypothetical protein